MIFSKQIEKMYSKTLFSRHDPDGTVFYFSYTDFPGLKCVPCEFKNQLDNTLKGAFYSYEGARDDVIVVFDHGMGAGGHRAYMREIEKLCKEGFCVLSYDHTGCAASEGEHIRGLSGSLADLDACISYIKKDGKLKGRELYVVGHSWGAFSTMNIVSYHPEVKKIVAMSGFISLKTMHKQLLRGPLALWRRTVFDLESRINSDYASANALESLKNTDAKVLLVYSKDDKTVSEKHHYRALQKALANRENVEILFVDDARGHNPNYTRDAVVYKNEFFRMLTEKKKLRELQTEDKKDSFVKSFDWYKITEQDEKVWQKIISHLND